MLNVKNTNVFSAYCFRVAGKPSLWRKVSLSSLLRSARSSDGKD